jgi:hypothetical protein
MTCMTCMTSCIKDGDVEVREFLDLPTSLGAADGTFKRFAVAFR